MNTLKIALILLSATAAACAQSATSPATGPKVLLWDASALRAARSSLSRGEPGLQPALVQLRAEAARALQLAPPSVMDKLLMAASGDKHDYFSFGPYWWPDPARPGGLPYIRRDGEVNPDSKKGTDDTAFGRMGEAVATLGLAYWFTGEEQYAQKAAALVRVWFLDPATRMNPNLEHAQAIPGVNDGRGIGIIESRHLTAICDALALLGDSPAWPAGDRAAFRQWLDTYYGWLTNSGHGRDEQGERNNHGSWYDVQASYLALALDRPAEARQILTDGLTRRLAHQVRPDGAQPLELARTKSLDYSLFNLEALFDCAALAEHVGLDWWRFTTPDGRSLRAALAYLAPYADPAKPWPKEDLHAADRSRLLPLFTRYLRHVDEPIFHTLLERFSTTEDRAGRWRLLLASAGADRDDERPLPEVIRDTLAVAAAQYDWMLSHQTLMEKMPRTFENGKLVTVFAKDWTVGFFPGSLWFLFEATGNPKWRTAAEHYTALLEPQQHNKGTHDVGFILSSSYGNGYRLTGADSYRSVLLQGAASLGTRFNPTVGCIKSWDRDPALFTYPVIIDNMMNLELLLWAARNGGDAHSREIAVSHADTTWRNHFRSDGSSFHVVDYNPATGAVSRRVTHQGAADGSAWARGQAWGLYGYTMMYRETKDPRYLDHAQRIASFIMHHPRLPADKVPYWDFDAPGIPDEPRDSSAAAIMCSALLELRGYVAPPEAATYTAFAEQQLRSLASPAYLAQPGENGGFLLKHATGNRPGHSEVDVPINYADYYFLEALLRASRVK